MTDTTYWIVRLDAFAFDTKDKAVKFREALEDAFCAMPEAAEYASATTVFQEGAEPVSVQEAARVLLTAWEEDPTPISHEVVVSIFNRIMGPDLREGFSAALRALAAYKGGA